ncbi:MAG: glutamine amidotransferase [Saprospiraceae bacterium]|nr:glutamine amidotransferase [Saprospiraceae bacterium]
MKTFLLIFGILFATSCTTKTSNDYARDSEAPSETLSAGFLIVDGVYNSELIAPFDIFQHTIFHTDGGIRVFTVAPNRDTITTFEGLKIIPDFDFTTSPPIDILVVPSAENSMDTDLENSEMINYVTTMGKRAKFNVSLCDGAFVLAKAGLVDGKESTTFPSDVERYRQMFPELIVHENVSFVHDGSLLTSQGGIKSYDVAMYLVEVIYGREVAKKVGKGLVIDWDPANYQFIVVK